MRIALEPVNFRSGSPRAAIQIDRQQLYRVSGAFGLEEWYGDDVSIQIEIWQCSGGQNPD